MLTRCVRLAELVEHAESGVPTGGTLLSRLLGVPPVGHFRLLIHTSDFSIHTNTNQLSSFLLLTECEKKSMLTQQKT